MNSLRILVGSLLCAGLGAALAKPLYNGVSFLSLQGFDGNNPSSPTNEKECYVLDHMNDASLPDVRNRLVNTLAAYQAAGVNLVRLMAYPRPDVGCDPSELGAVYIFWNSSANRYDQVDYSISGATARANRVASVNSFMALAATYGMKTEIVFVTSNQANGVYTDFPTYYNDKDWITYWMQHLNLSNVALFEVTQEALIHSYSLQANGDYAYYPNVLSSDNNYPRAKSTGDYLKVMWPWFRSTFPNVDATVEMYTPGSPPGDLTGILGGTTYAASPLITEGTANWIGQNLPGAAYASIETYFYLGVPPVEGSETWKAYRKVAANLMAAYFGSNFYHTTHTPLWIDEFGHLLCLTNECNSSETTQSNYIHGMLSASQFYSSSQFGGRVAWVGSDDVPYDNRQVFGLLSSYSGTTPVFRPAWNWIHDFYLLNPSSTTVAKSPVPLLLGE